MISSNSSQVPLDWYHRHGAIVAPCKLKRWDHIQIAICLGFLCCVFVRRNVFSIVSITKVKCSCSHIFSQYFPWILWVVANVTGAVCSVLLGRLSVMLGFVPMIAYTRCLSLTRTSVARRPLPPRRTGWKHWNGNTDVLTKFSSLEVVLWITPSDGNFIKMTTYSFQRKSTQYNFRQH